MTVAVLTYHAFNISGNEYHNNDHVALESDLRVFLDNGFEVVSLDKAVEARQLCDVDQRLVALTFDDGPSLDVEDFVHPSCGPQKSFYNVMQQFDRRTGRTTVASAFVIASPHARTEMDRVDLGGRDWWHDRWWRSATDSGRILIENHSWDHNHPSLKETAHKNNESGRFDKIDNLAECDAEVRQASDYIARTAGRRPRYLAYPWGQSSTYIRSEYLPRQGQSIGLHAAFGAQGRCLAPDDDRWNLPRLVCGAHWRSPDELLSLLEAA